MPAGEPGQTRTCPHCKSTILASADVCPACHHHLRFGADRRAAAAAAPETLFKLEGTVRAPSPGETCEYDVVVALYDEAGAELAREVVHVGALKPSASRRCVVSIVAHPVAAGAERPRLEPAATKLPGARRRLF